MKDRAWIEVSHKALLNNLHKIENSIGRSKVMAVVKDQTYGMGMDAAFALQEAGVDFFAVSTIDEGIQLRQIGIFQPVLVFGYTHPNRFGELVDFDLIQTIISSEYLIEMNKYGLSHQPLEAHLKVNTGMNRLGISYKNIDEIKSSFILPGLNISGIYSHLLSADQPGKGHQKALLQMQIFDELLTFLDDDEINYGVTHLLNSHGIVYFGFSHQYDYVRPGLHLTGSIEFEGYENAFSLLARVATVNQVNRCENVGYGIENILDHQCTVATVSIGYGDGLERRLASLGYSVLINNILCSLVGRICMDQLLVDVSEVEVHEGNLVKLIYDDFSAADMAQLLGTIPNEILTRFSSRLQRILVYEKK